MKWIMLVTCALIVCAQEGKTAEVEPASLKQLSSEELRALQKAELSEVTAERMVAEAVNDVNVAMLNCEACVLARATLHNARVKLQEQQKALAVAKDAAEKRLGCKLDEDWKCAAVIPKN